MESAFVKADQKIFHSAAYPSRLILPVVEPAGLK
jgi:predicted acyl esterase